MYIRCDGVADGLGQPHTDVPELLSEATAMLWRCIRMHIYFFSSSSIVEAI